jgi:hypothetical protein
MDDAAGFAGVCEVNFHAIEERFLFEQRDQLFAVDEQNTVLDNGLRSEADILDVNEIEIQSHGSLIIIYRHAWVGAGGRTDEDGRLT